jgi:oligopeptide/dipeptide ABC transporter ATP-binding protein
MVADNTDAPSDAAAAVVPSPPRQSVLSVRDLTVSFPTDDGLAEAVRGVSYDLVPGEVLGIVGESGSGKSVSSLAVMGLLPPTSRIAGSVTFDGRELIGASYTEMQRIRGDRIAMVFQDPMTSLNPVYSVGYQVAEAIRAHSSASKHEAFERAVDLLDLMGIPQARQRAGDYPHQFSGGMRQRVVIAIAMANKPSIIIADEPTTALDVTVQAQILDALATARQETGAAMVLITHDLGVIAGYADRVLVMYAGKVVESGDVEDIFYRPRMPYTLGLLGSLPRLDGGGERLTPIVGNPPSAVNPRPGCPFAPRCPLHRDICDRVEPPLDAVAGSGHVAACHFSTELIGRSPSDVFAPPSRRANPPAPDIKAAGRP